MRVLIVLLWIWVLVGFQAGEVTPEITPDDITNDTLTATIPSEGEMTAEATSATLDNHLTLVSGRVIYQNRLPNDSGIVIEVWSANHQQLAVAISDDNGGYTVHVPNDEPLRFVFKAPLHRMNAFILQPLEVPPLMILAGGDLNQDGCIGEQDVAILKAYFNQSNTPYSDINGDNLTDIADLAILSGNYDAMCELILSLSTPTLAPTLPSATPTPPAAEATEGLEVTAEIELTLEEATVEITPEITQAVHPTEILTPTDALTPEWTAEATETPAPESTVEITATATATRLMTLTVTIEASPTQTPEQTETVTTSDP